MTRSQELSETADGILEASDRGKVRSSTALWEKWFQTLVITALMTYSAVSFPPPFLTLPPISLFVSASTLLLFRTWRLLLCHPPYFSWFSSFISKRFHICRPNLFPARLSDALNKLTTFLQNIISTVGSRSLCPS